MSYIRTPEALAEAIAAFSREPLVAADTEAASFHRYRDRIFLIQLSTPSRTEIIDPLAVTDLAPVGRLLVDAKVELIGRHFPSQAGKHWFDEELLRALMRLRGMECASRYAEAFTCRKLPLLP